MARPRSICPTGTQGVTMPPKWVLPMLSVPTTPGVLAHLPAACPASSALSCQVQA